MRKLKAWLRSAIGGAFALVISACYGPMIGDFNDSLKGEFRVKDENQQPIGDLTIAMIDTVRNVTNQLTFTGEDGVAKFDYFTHETNLVNTNRFVIKDTDGLAYGGQFETFVTNVLLDNYTNYYVYDITMTRVTQ